MLRDTKLIKALLEKKLRIIYDTYSDLNNKPKKQITAKSAVGTLATTSSIGTAVGTVIPGAGNLIGLGVGAGLGLGILVIDAAKNKIYNAKKENAQKVINNVNNYCLLVNEIDRVINDRKQFFDKIKDTEKNKKLISDYIAVNMFKAVKASKHHSDPKVMMEEVHRNLISKHSKKILSTTLETEDKKCRITLSELRKIKLKH